MLLASEKKTPGVVYYPTPPTIKFYQYCWKHFASVLIFCIHKVMRVMKPVFFVLLFYKKQFRYATQITFYFYSVLKCAKLH